LYQVLVHQRQIDVGDNIAIQLFQYIKFVLFSIEDPRYYG